MTLTWTVVVVWVLAMLLTGGTATHITASVGENVLLPCNCSKTTDQVVWQTGAIVVNQYHVAETENTGPEDDSYKDRSRLFLSSEKGNCALLLLQVSFSDQEKFTCYTFDENGMRQTDVSLNITERLTVTQTDDLPPHGDLPSSNVSSEPGIQKRVDAGVSAGIPASLVALLLVAGAVIGVLVMRKRHRNTQERDIVEDLEAGVPIMKVCPV